MHKDTASMVHFSDEACSHSKHVAIIHISPPGCDAAGRGAAGAGAGTGQRPHVLAQKPPCCIQSALHWPNCFCWSQEYQGVCLSVHAPAAAKKFVEVRVQTHGNIQMKAVDRISYIISTCWRLCASAAGRLAEVALCHPAGAALAPDLLLLAAVATRRCDITAACNMMPAGDAKHRRKMVAGNSL